MSLSKTLYPLLSNGSQPFLNQRKGGEWPYKSFHDQSPQVWDWAGIQLATPRSADRYASVVRPITNCAKWPGKQIM